MSMNIVDTINESWGWNGLEAVKVVAENEFGNLLIKDRTGRYWRMCPEELSCKVVAQNREELDTLSVDPEFVQDWCMQRLVELARNELGPLMDDRKYCLKIPGVLGGQYAASNLATITLTELVRASGDLSKQISDLPDGAKVRLVVTD